MAGRERGKNGFTLFNPATHKAAEAEADLSHCRGEDKGGHANSDGVAGG